MELHPSSHYKSQEKTAGWCRTNMQVSNFSYTWTITNYSMHTEKIDSSIFSTGETDEMEWLLTVHPHGDPDGTYLSLYLKLVSATRPEVKAKFTFSILNVDSAKTYIKTISKPVKFVKDTSSGFKYFLSNSQLTGNTLLLPNDNLTIFVEVSVIVDVVNITKGNTKSHIKVQDCQLIGELKALLETKQLSDIVFNVCGRDISAHKAILAARSPVFSAMFQLEMTEKLSGRVEVNDIGFAVFSEMLHYIYTGETPNLYNLAEGLLEAAEKYNLTRLKALSEVALCKTLGIENAAKRLMLADFYKAYRLKSLAINFINMHTKEVVKTQGFEQMVATYPVLMTDVLLGSVAEKRIADEDKNRESIVEIMLLLPGDFMETKIVLSIYWAGRCIFRCFRDFNSKGENRSPKIPEDYLDRTPKPRRSEFSRFLSRVFN